MRGLTLLLLGLALAVHAAAAPQPHDEDATVFCRFVADEYAYFDLKATDWPATCAALAADARTPMDQEAFIGRLEQALRELYDAHAHLGTNTPSSYRLVPSQTDLIAAWRGEHAIVTAVRRGSSAARAGIRAGDEIVAIDGEAVAEATRALEPRHLSRPDPAARDAALQIALAGRHDHRHQFLRVRTAPWLTEIELERDDNPPARPPMSFTRIGQVGVVTVNDALGDMALVAAFDAALATTPAPAALVIDLRDTPHGGTSTVARGLMSRLVDRMRPYQRHEAVDEFRASGIRRVWVEQVMPRGTPFRGPVVVLVGHWTGSMGEGIAIGLNGAIGAAVLGAPMARLLGALGETTLPQSHIVVRVPVEKLSHVDGTPREAFVPCPLDADTGNDADDPALDAAVAVAARLVAHPAPSRAGRACPALPSSTPHPRSPR